MLRKTIFSIGLYIAFAIGSPFWYHTVDPGPELTGASATITPAPSLTAASLQNRNAVPSRRRFCDKKPCVAIKIIHGITTESPCHDQIECITYAKRGLPEIGVPPTLVAAVRRATTQPPIGESKSSKNTFIELDETTTFYVYITEEITSSNSKSVFSATTLAPTSTSPKATTTPVSSMLLRLDSTYMAGVTETSSTQSHGAPSGTLQSSTLISTKSANSKPPSSKIIRTPPPSHFQPPTTRPSPLGPTLGTSNAVTGTSTISRSTSPPTHGLTSVTYEVSAMPVTTHSPTVLTGVDRISAVITDISLLISILTATQASTSSLIGSRRTTDVGVPATPTRTLTSPSVTTYISSALPTTFPSLGIAGISSVITDITLLESILAATSTFFVSIPASTQTMAKSSIAAPSSSTLVPSSTSGTRDKSITATRTITRTVSPPNATGGPKQTGNPVWGTGKTTVQCTCQCGGKRFNLTATKPV